MGILSNKFLTKPCAFNSQLNSIYNKWRNNDSPGEVFESLNQIRIDMCTCTFLVIQCFILAHCYMYLASCIASHVHVHACTGSNTCAYTCVHHVS